MWELAISCLLFGDVSEVNLPSATEVACRDVDDLARHYRIQVYNTFRTQRDVYDQWAAKGFEVLEFSRLLPVQSSQQQQLGQWFQTAAVATQSGQAIPETPQIDLSQIAIQTESSEAASKTDRQELPADAETVTQVEQETTTHTVSSPDSDQNQSSLPWGAVGRMLFHTEENSDEAQNTSESSPSDQ